MKIYFGWNMKRLALKKASIFLRTHRTKDIRNIGKNFRANCPLCELFGIGYEHARVSCPLFLGNKFCGDNGHPYMLAYNTFRFNDFTPEVEKQVRILQSHIKKWKPKLIYIRRNK